jgi:hypothetical protein
MYVLAINYKNFDGSVLMKCKMWNECLKFKIPLLANVGSAFLL